MSGAHAIAGPKKHLLKKDKKLGSYDVKGGAFGITLWGFWEIHRRESWGLEDFCNVLLFSHKMKKKKVSTTVYLTEDQVEALRQLHDRTRVPVAEYIRMGIDLILSKYAEKLPGQVSLFDELSESDLGYGNKKNPPDSIE